MNIFRKKKGGTFLGNLFRKAIRAVPIVGNMLQNWIDPIPTVEEMVHDEGTA